MSPRPVPDPTPADGPDPYGNPDPEWLRVDWAKFRKTISVPAADPGIQNVPPASSASRPGAAGSGVGTTAVNYVEVGPSEEEQDRLALVFVHGLSGCWQNWLEQLPHFARTHRVIALDLPGFGDSPPPPWEVTIKSYGRFVLDFCSAIGVRDAAVVGNSLGGFVAAETAIAEPGRFEKIVLASAAGVSTVQMSRRPTAMVARMLAAGAPLIFRLQDRTFRRPAARARAFAGICDRPDLLRPELLWEFYTGGNRGTRFAEALTSLAGYDILDRLEEVDVPALIVWGRQDRIVPPADAIEFHRRLRHSRLEVFERCGHLPMAERPARFNRVLEAFVAA